MYTAGTQLVAKIRRDSGWWRVLAALVLLGVARHAAGQTGGSALELRPVVLQDDPTAIGGPVARFLAPADWKVEGRVQWDMRRIFNPAGATVRLTSPDGRRQIVTLPKICFTWSPRSLGIFPRGSMYIGQEVEPVPHDGADAITRFVVPRYLRDALEGARVTQTLDLPKLAAAATRQLNGDQARGAVAAKAVAVRVRFAGGKIPSGFAVDVYAVTGAVPMPAIATVDWGIDQIVAIAGPEADLEQSFHLYEMMAGSTRLDPHWFNIYAQVCDGLRQMTKNASDAAVVRSRIIAHAQQQVSDSIRERYEQHEAAMDKIHEAYDETIRGVQRWNNGGGEQVELPNGYDFAWRSNDGRYFVTDNPLTDPNHGSDTNWSKLSKAE